MTHPRLCEACGKNEGWFCAVLFGEPTLLCPVCVPLERT